MNRVLVTGGAGSIGQELVKHYLKNSSIVCVFDNNEDGLFKLKSKLKQEFPKLQHRLRYFLGDIRDQKRLFNALKDVDIVFHCAALKHVGICEYNPTEAVATNIIGTQNIIESGKIYLDSPTTTPNMPTWRRVESAAPGIINEIKSAVVSDKNEV